MALGALAGLLVPALIDVGRTVASNIFPNPEDERKKQALENQLTAQLQASADRISEAAAQVIQTEAASRHWLAANWRPLTMLTFVSLIVARWLGYSAEGMTEAEYVAVYDLIELGLGGYVIGRTAEKIAPGIISAFRK